VKRNNFLPIGEVAKLTGASIISLRYYEKIKILKPAHIDMDSGYRYYAFEQIFHIQVIKVCVELGIPLKELLQFADDTGVIDYLSLLAYGKKIANSKLQRIHRGMRFIDTMEQKITLAEKYQQEQKIYARDIDEKIFYVIPYDKPFDSANPLEMVKSFLGFKYGDSDYAGELVEFGLMCVFSPNKVERYAFVELEECNDTADIRLIPAGSYLCTQNEVISIEETPKIFADKLIGTASYMAIETIFIASKYEVGKPISELRVLKKAP